MGKRKRRPAPESAAMPAPVDEPAASGPDSKQMARGLLPVAVGVVILVAAGLTQAHLHARAAASNVAAAAARLDTIPKRIGEWDTIAQETPTEDYRRFGFAGILTRRFVERTTGAEVTVMLVCGAPGPISVHTPEVCFPGVGYRVEGERTRRQIPAGAGIAAAEFWEVQMKKSGPVSDEDVTVDYSWSADGRWYAPDGDPRIRFALAPSLYKLYVIRKTGPDGAWDPPTEAFVKRLLTALNGSLFGDPAEIGR